MNLHLSWDLFVFVFLVLIVVYSFIIGRDNTLKVMLGSYVAALAADAIGNIFGKYFAGARFLEQIVDKFAGQNEIQAIIMVKVLVFIVFVVLLAVRGAFSVTTSSHRGKIARIAILFTFGLISATFIISTIVVYISGISFIDGSAASIVNTELEQIYSNSRLIKIMVDYHNFWFSLPAVCLIFPGFILKSDE